MTFPLAPESTPESPTAHAAILRECPDCGAFSCLPPLQPGTRACCPRCGHVMRRHIKRAPDRALAWTIAGLIFYVLTITLPFISVQLSGQTRFSNLMTGPDALEQEGFLMLGVLVFMFSIAMPLLKLLLMLAVLIGMRLKCPPTRLPWLYRMLKQVTPWAMVEVYLLGLFIAYTRLVALARVDLQTAVYALVALMLCSAAADAVMDEETIWGYFTDHGLRYRPPPKLDLSKGTDHLVGCEYCHAISEHKHRVCHRCGGMLHRRKPASIQRCWALLVAAALLYLPANAFTVMTTIKLGRELPHTILGGADELLEAGLWPLALLVFVASIMVPMLKFVSLGVMLVNIHRCSAWRLHGRTKLYRIIDFIGRWSMIDVFMISILVALVQFGKLAQVTAGGGAAAFASVVVLTMFATEVFDPRLMWDATAQRPESGISAGDE